MRGGRVARIGRRKGCALAGPTAAVRTSAMPPGLGPTGLGGQPASAAPAAWASLPAIARESPATCAAALPAQ